MNRMILGSMLVLVAVAATFAAEGAATAAAALYSSSALAAGIGLGLAAAGCGVGMGLCVASTLQGIARQPELTSKLQVNMMIGLAFIEAQLLYVLFIAILLLFANPLAKKLGL